MAYPFKDERGHFIGKARAPRTSPQGFKVCSRCNDEKSIEQFSPDHKTTDGLHCWCRPCRTEDTRERRRIERGKMTPEEKGIKKLRLTRSMLIQRVTKLVIAAQAARTAGCWRGREAIRAYRDLGIAIESFHVDAPEGPDAIEKGVGACSCHTSPLDCRRHADAVEAYFASHPPEAA